MILFAVVVPISGCPAEPQQEVSGPATWAGRFESDDGCSDGLVELRAIPEGDGSYTAIFDYRVAEEHDPDHGAHARYTLLGTGDATALELSSVAREADALMDGMWCNGIFSLQTDPPPGYLTRLTYRALGYPLPAASMHGSWTATDCTCTGSFELELVPTPVDEHYLTY
jgi:hypothetical protein